MGKWRGSRIKPFKANVNVTLHTSNLTGKDGSSVRYGRIKRRRMNVITILGELQRDHATIMDKATMFYVASELSSRMMEKPAQSYALEMLDFGTLYLTVKGEIPNGASSSKVAEKLGIGFTPSKKAEEAVRRFNVTLLEPRSPRYIKDVRLARTSDTELQVIVAGDVARLRGAGLKLGGGDSGVFIAPLGNDGKSVARSEWIKVETVTTNLPSRLEFIVPSEAGRYAECKIVVRTSLAPGGKPMKAGAEVQSAVVRIEGVRE